MADNPDVLLEQAQSAAISAREKLPQWISKPMDTHAFSEFLREIGIYDKSDQYICWIIKSYAELAHKYRIKISDFVSYVVKYAASNKIIHLQVDTTAQATIQKVLTKLIKEKYAAYDEANKMMILFDPSSLEYYYHNFELMLTKYYKGMEEHIERSFPADQTLMSNPKVSTLEVWHNVEWKHYNEANVDAFSDPNRLKILRFLFPDRSQVVVHPGYVSQILQASRNKINYIISFLKAKDPKYINDLVSFMNKKIPELNIDLNRLEYLLKDSVQSNVRFWMVLMANLERYFGANPKLVSFYQAACFMHAWAQGMEQKEQENKILKENIQKLWHKITQTPILYTQSDIQDVARSIQLDRLYKDNLAGLIEQAIVEFTKVPQTKNPVYLQRLMLNNKACFVVNNHLADIFMSQMEIIKEKYKQHYLNDWRAKFKNRTYNADPLISSAAEYLKDLYHRLSSEEQEFYGMAHDQAALVIAALNNYSDRNRLADWKRKHFKRGVDVAFASMDVLLDLRHGDLVSEAEAYSPFLRLFPIFKKLLFMFKSTDTDSANSKGSRKKSSLVKDAMTNVINSQKKPPRSRKKTVKSAAPAPAPEKPKELESVDDRKKAIREKLQEIQTGLFGNKNIMDELQFLEKKWNRTLEQNLTKKEEIRKENKKYVVSIIQSHIKNIKLNIQNVENIAKNIRDDQQFKNIKDVEALEKYIQGYIILTLQKKNA